MGRDIDSLKIMKKLTLELLDAKEASDTRYERLIICCKVTDVLVLLTYFASELCQEIWIQTGNFKSPKFIKCTKYIFRT